MKSIFTLFLSLFLIYSSNAQVLINEIYGGGGNTGATWNRDVVQLKNFGGSAVTLTGWSIQYAAAGGSSWLVNAIPTTTINPGDVLNVMLGTQNIAVGSNPPTPSVLVTSGTTNIATASGKLGLFNNTTAFSGNVCPSGANVEDYVSYGTNPTGCTQTTGPTSATVTNSYRRVAGNTSSPGTFAISTTPLPVDLISFDVKKFGSQVQLSWATASEINNDYFQVERSMDGVNFLAIGRVEPKISGERTNTYSFVDNNAVSGINYYRLRQVDIDGRFAFSGVRSIRFGSDKSSFIELAPNPASTEVKISFESSSLNTTISVIDITGRIILSREVAAGNSVENLNISDLQSGVYIVRANNDLGSSVSTLIKN
jgi:hypothetical protein